MILKSVAIGANVSEIVFSAFRAYESANCLEYRLRAPVMFCHSFAFSYLFFLLSRCILKDIRKQGKGGEGGHGSVR